MITVNLKIFREQYNGIVDSNMNKETKEGILNLLSAIEWDLTEWGKAEIELV